MWILPLVGYAGVFLGFSFLTLAIASGLYYLSELVEEHSVFARKLLTRLIYSVIATQILLALIDRFPIWLSLLSLVSHGVYMGNLRHFPTVKLSDPVFVLSCALVLTNHFLWFHHFSSPPPPLRNPSPAGYNRYNPPPAMPTFTEIAAFFGICVWLVPFALFVSLSASENVLPSMGSEYATGGQVRGGLDDDDDGGRRRGGGGGGRKKGLVKAVVDGGLEWVGGVGEVFGLGGKEGRGGSRF